jgi:hypothetical protein
VQEGKQFFFEKKNQKTFVYCFRRLFQYRGRMLPETGKSFLLLFFKKEVLAFIPPRYSEDEERNGIAIAEFGNRNGGENA